MKKILLATTAMVGASLLSHTAFADELNVRVGGFFVTELNFVNDDADNNNDVDLTTDSEVHVNLKGKTDSGFEYGGRIEFETDSNRTDNTDEAYIFIKGGFGRVEFGDQDGAHDQVINALILDTAIYANGDGPGDAGIDGSYVDILNAGGSLLPANTSASDSSDQTKITYYTPVFSGFKAGISYIPQVGGSNVGANVNFNSDLTNGVELGLTYDQEFDALTVQLGFGYFTANGEGSTGDINAYHLGAAFKAGQFTFGGAYINNGDNDIPNIDDEYEYWVAGTYSNGPLVLGAQYGFISSEGDNGAGDSGDDEGKALGLGATYYIADALRVYADLVLFDADDGDSSDNDADGYSLILGTGVNF
jgi:outer membrane protein OmpU